MAPPSVYCIGGTAPPPPKAQPLNFNMRRAVAAFAVYALLSVALDAIILLHLPRAEDVQDVLDKIIWLMTLQVLVALGIIGSILHYRENSAVMLATAASSIYLMFIITALIAILRRLFEPALSAASLLASAIVALVAAASVPALSAALALSLAHLVVKLRRGDYGGASLALFFAFISALALLSLTLL